LDNRLWDERGQEWTREFRWLRRNEVEALLKDGDRVVVHRYHAPLRWLDPAEAKSYWLRIDEHAQYGDEGANSLDDDGLTYAAVEWRREGDRLLGFEESC
jgi:hypothetical protein